MEMETFKNHLLQRPKNPVATTQKSRCNIQKSSISTSKKPIATRRNSKGHTNSKGM
jgi:hypothetical protein